MGGGIAFLSKKAFNPSNISNQKIVWKAEQIALQERKRIAEREKQLRIERDHEEFAKARGDKNEIGRASLRFMYDAPPGLNKKNSLEKNYDSFFERDDIDIHGKKKNSDFTTEKNPLLVRQDNDDNAAAEFREMLADTINRTKSSELSNVCSNNPGKSNKLPLTSIHPNELPTKEIKYIQHINTENLTQLEKAVGRKEDAWRGAMNYATQMERFPQLRNAPLEIKKKGHDITDVATMNIRFKPLGTQIRNVRCLECGVWGHGRGDRECSIGGWDPFSQNAISTITQSSTNTSISRDTTLRGNKLSTIQNLSSSTRNNNRYKKSITPRKGRHPIDIRYIKEGGKFRKRAKRIKKY